MSEEGMEGKRGVVLGGANLKCWDVEFAEVCDVISPTSSEPETGQKPPTVQRTAKKYIVKWSGK